VIDGGERPREHGRPDLAHAEGDELIDLGGLGGHGGGKGERVLPGDPAGGQEDVLIAKRVGLADDVAAVLVAGAEGAVGDAEEFVVVRAKGGEPGDFTLAGGGANG
jgi:hypothetical protein